MRESQRQLIAVGRPHQGAFADKPIDRVVNHAKREFRLSIGPIGEVDYSWQTGVRLGHKAQLREDAQTLCLSLGLRLQYHPASTYVISLVGQSSMAREAILKALGACRQFVVRQGRDSGFVYVTQREGWKPVPDGEKPEGDSIEPVESCTESGETAGIFSSGEAVEAEELDDLTIHLRESVEALMAALKPFKVTPTHQLELF